MKKRDTYDFLMRSHRNQYNRKTGTWHDVVTYDIRKFKLVKRLSHNDRPEYIMVNGVPVEFNVFEHEVFNSDGDDQASDEVTTGDEYVPVDEVCPKEMRFKTRSAAILKASILGICDLYEFKKNIIPHPLTFSVVKKLAKKV